LTFYGYFFQQHQIFLYGKGTPELTDGDEWSLLGAIGIHLTLTLNPNPTSNPDPTPNPKSNPIGSYTVYM